MKKQTQINKKEMTTIQVEKDTRNHLMIFKINTNAKDLNSVIKFMIERLNSQLKESK